MAESGQYSRSILGASDEVKDINCEPCHQGGRVAIAKGYCVDCPEYLCAQCFNSHGMHKAFANHVLLNKDSMPVAHDSSRNVLDVCEEKCPSHSNKVTEFFCETCDKLGCHVCVTLNHRQCETVKHIPDIVNDLEHTEEFKKFNEDIKSKANQLSKCEEKLKAKVTANKDMRKFAKQELAHQRAEVNKFFDELEKKMNDQITAIEKRNKDTLKAATDRLDEMKKDFDQIKNDIEAKNTGKKCEMFIAMKRSMEKMIKLKNNVDKMQELGIQYYKLLPSEEIEVMMRTTTEICRLATARLESVIDMKTCTDKTEPSMRGLAIMHGHYCVVVDNNNKIVKVIDTQNKHVISEIGIEAKTIWSVTSVSEDQVAVSVILSDRRPQIQYFTVSASGVIQRIYKVYHVDTSYYDIVHYKGNIYGVNDHRIDVLNMRGKIIRTIQPDDNGEELFGCLGEIALSPDGQTLYVINSWNSVLSLTLDDKVKAVYKDNYLKRLLGITVDKHGYVYVRSYGSHNIQQLTADLKKVQVLIDNVFGICIAYSSAEHKLYISNRDQINQYSLDFK